MQPDNDNTKWTDEQREEATAAHAAFRRSLAAAQKAEAKSVQRAGARVRSRQMRGEEWDGKPDNDNMGWPLAKALKADGKEYLLRAAMEYRRIEASANSGAQLGGTSIGLEPVQVDQKTWVRPDGQMVYRGERRLTAAAYAEIPATQSIKTTPSTMKPSAPVPKPWNGDSMVNAMVDDKRRLSRLRSVLGALTEAFEDAVVGGKTLEDIGRGAGAGRPKGASAAGRALVMIGLYAVQSELQRIRMDESAPSLRSA